MTTPLSDADIRARIGHGRRCLLCREDRAAGVLCWTHHDELDRILDPDYLGDRDLERAASIPVLYARLDPTPRVLGLADRRAPGFGSEPPLGLDVVVMRDARSVGWPVVEVWYEPRFPGISSAPDLDHPHYEDDNPPRAVEKAVAGVADVVWDELGYGEYWERLGLPAAAPARPVEDHCRWLHSHLAHITARDDAPDIHGDLVELHDQLRRAAGDPKPRPCAHCTGWVPDRDTGGRVQCGAPLFLPPPRPGVKIKPSEPVLQCGRCRRPYSHLMLLRLEINAEREAS